MSGGRAARKSADISLSSPELPASWRLLDVEKAERKLDCVRVEFDPDAFELVLRLNGRVPFFLVEVVRTFFVGAADVWRGFRGDWGRRAWPSRGRFEGFE